jgi:predicted metal-dependent hydrolase
VDRESSLHLIAQLNRDAERIAGRFGLRYKSIEAERANVKNRYGICYADGGIKIRLRHSVTGRALKYSSLVNTLCHELAHLRHFNHGERFKAFYLQLLDFARAEGVYRPGRSRAEPAAAAARPPPSEPPRLARPLQLGLFG